MGMQGTGRFAGGGFESNSPSPSGTTTRTPGPKRTGLNAEEKLVLQISEVLDQRHVTTGTISYGLQTQEFHVQQRLMDIILELLNLWRIDCTPEFLRLYPNHPLRSVYETADRMLAALETTYVRQPDDTGPIPLVEGIEGMVERLPKNNRR